MVQFFLRIVGLFFTFSKVFVSGQNPDVSFGEALLFDALQGTGFNFGSPLGTDPNHGAGFNFGEPLGVDPNHALDPFFGEPLGMAQGSGMTSEITKSVQVDPQGMRAENLNHPIEHLVTEQTHILPATGLINSGHKESTKVKDNAKNQAVNHHITGQTDKLLGPGLEQHTDLSFGEPLGMVPGHGVSIHKDPPGVHGNTLNHAVDHIVTGQKDVLAGHDQITNVNNIHMDLSFGEPLGMFPGHEVSIHKDPPRVHGNTRDHAVDHIVTGQKDVLPGHGQDKHMDLPFGEPLGIVPGHEVSIHKDPPGVHGNTRDHAVDHIVTGQTDILTGHADMPFGEPMGMVAGHGIPAGVHGNSKDHAVDHIVTGQTDIHFGPGSDLHTDMLLGEALGMVPSPGVSTLNDPTGVKGKTLKHDVGHLDTQQTHIIDVANSHKGLAPEKHDKPSSKLSNVDLSMPKQISGKNYMSGLGARLKSKSSGISKSNISPFTKTSKTNIGHSQGLDMHMGESIGMVAGQSIPIHKDPPGVHGNTRDRAVNQLVTGQKDVLTGHVQDIHTDLPFGEPLGMVLGHEVSIHKDPPGVHGNTRDHAVDHIVTGQKDIIPGHGPNIHVNLPFGEPIGMVSGHGVSIHKDPPGVHGNTLNHAVDHIVTGQKDVLAGHDQITNDGIPFGEPMGMVTGHGVSIHKDPPGVHGNTRDHAVDHLVSGQKDILPGHGQDIHMDLSFGEPLGMFPGHEVSIHKDPPGVHGNTRDHAVDHIVTGQKDVLLGHGQDKHMDLPFGEPLGIVPGHEVSIHKDPPGVHGNTRDHAVDHLVTGQTDLLLGHGPDMHASLPFSEPLGLDPGHGVSIHKDPAGAHAVDHLVTDKTKVNEVQVSKEPFVSDVKSTKVMGVPDLDKISNIVPGKSIKNKKRKRKQKGMTMEEKVANAESMVSSLMSPGKRKSDKDMIGDKTLPKGLSLPNSEGKPQIPLTSGPLGMLQDAMSDVTRMSRGLGSLLGSGWNNQLPRQNVPGAIRLGHGERERERERGYPRDGIHLPGFGRTMEINPNRPMIGRNLPIDGQFPLIQRPNRFINELNRSRYNPQPGVRLSRRQNRRNRRNRRRRVRNQWNDGGVRRNLRNVARRLMG